MALETIVFSQDLYSNSNSNNNNFGMNPNDFINYSSMLLLENNLPFPTNNVGLFDIINPNNTNPNPEILVDNLNQWDCLQQQQYNVFYDYSSPENYISGEASPVVVPPNVSPTETGVRKKRRRRSGKNKEEVEQQRMTHIAVERNRRKQMNEYLASIRSLMPPSYVQRGDQASIVAGAINYVKELEQLLQSKEAQKKQNKVHQEVNQKPSSPEIGGDVDEGNVVVAASSSENEPSPVFADFFSFPQYSTRSNQVGGSKSVSSNSASGEIEVTMVESHANVKILAKKQPKQLVKLIAGFQGLRLNVLHLNVTTLDSYVLYSLSLKVEEGCQLNSVDDIAAAANHIIAQIQEEVANLRQ